MPLKQQGFFEARLASTIALKLHVDIAAFKINPLQSLAFVMRFLAAGKVVDVLAKAVGISFQAIEGDEVCIPCQQKPTALPLAIPTPGNIGV